MDIILCRMSAPMPKHHSFRLLSQKKIWPVHCCGCCRCCCQFGLYSNSLWWNAYDTNDIKAVYCIRDTSSLSSLIKSQNGEKRTATKPNETYLKQGCNFQLLTENRTHLQTGPYININQLQPNWICDCPQKLFSVLFISIEINTHNSLEKHFELSITPAISNEIDIEKLTDNKHFNVSMSLRVRM